MIDLPFHPVRDWTPANLCAVETATGKVVTDWRCEAVEGPDWDGGYVITPRLGCRPFFNSEYISPSCGKNRHTLRNILSPEQLATYLPHNGGGKPKGEIVEVLLRDGASTPWTIHFDLCWGWEDDVTDIIGYRLAEPKTETQPDALPEGVTVERVQRVLQSLDFPGAGWLRTAYVIGAREALLQPKPPVDPLVEQSIMGCPQCDGEGGYPDGLDPDACHTDCTRCGGIGWIVDTEALAKHVLTIKDAGNG